MRPLSLIVAVFFVFATFSPLVRAAVSADGHGPCVCKLEGLACAGGDTCPVTCPHHEGGRHGAGAHHGDGMDVPTGNAAAHDDGHRHGGAEAGRDSGAGQTLARSHGQSQSYDKSNDAPGETLRCGCAGHGDAHAAQHEDPYAAPRAVGPCSSRPAFSPPAARPLYTGPDGAVPDHPPSV